MASSARAHTRMNESMLVSLLLQNSSWAAERRMTIASAPLPTALVSARIIQGDCLSISAFPYPIHCPATALQGCSPHHARPRPYLCPATVSICFLAFDLDPATVSTRFLASDLSPAT
eukprot:scaffold20074_cov20-Tisochrysis_lutea.AAC.1